MSARYDRIGRSYDATRGEDPRIAAQIWAALGDAETVLNVGAGTGHYEPRDRAVTAVEPSPVMRAQRPPGSAPAIDAAAGALPFADGAFDAAMAILSDHHWPDHEAGLRELRRVARRAVLLQWDSTGREAFWLARDYMPRWALDVPPLREAMAALGPARFEVVPIPHDCRDGFLMAYWRRPEAYLDPVVRANISVFALMPDDEEEALVEALRADLETRRLAGAQRGDPRGGVARPGLSARRRGMRVAELRRRRAAAQLLVPGERAAADVVRRLLAVQAQDPRAARVALRARGAERVDESALVTTWLLRGTLHLVAVEDLGWLHALTGALVRPQTERRLAELGAAPARALRVIERALADGPRSRADLADRLRAAGLAAEGQIVPHLLGLAASRGTLVLVGDAYALTADVVPAARALPDRDAALAELARRYLRGHGPATPDDLAAWSGLGLGDARRGFAAIAVELADAGGRSGLRDAPEPPRRLPPRLLPAFDPYLLGWRDRGFAVDAAHARDVHPGGGIIRAVALVNGRAAGTWKRGRGGIEVAPFAPLPARVAAALAREAERIEGSERRH